MPAQSGAESEKHVLAVEHSTRRRAPRRDIPALLFEFSTRRGAPFRHLGTPLRPQRHGSRSQPRPGASGTLSQCSGWGAGPSSCLTSSTRALAAAMSGPSCVEPSAADRSSAASASSHIPFARPHHVAARQPRNTRAYRGMSALGEYPRARSAPITCALPSPSLKAPSRNFMEITAQSREFAKEKGLDTEEAVTAGLTSKSEEFTETGGEIYS
jgi:hypothetical protein